MNYWMFKANPDHYRIDDRLLNPAAEITWAVTRYHERIQKGDTVFIWRAGTPRGICAVMLIDECPYLAQEKDLDDGYQLPAARNAPIPAHYAKGHLTQRFPIIETSVIKKIDGLELFSFFSAFQQATNFTLTRPEGTILLQFIEEHRLEWQNQPRQIAAKPVAKTRKADPTPAPGARKTKSAVPASVSNEAVLLKCQVCGRYVVSSDTDRHARESHPGDIVDFKKTK
jgi:hypothetical protein